MYTPLIPELQWLCSKETISPASLIPKWAVATKSDEEYVAVSYYVITLGLDSMIDRDYKTYDKKMPAVFIRAAFWVLDQWRGEITPLTEREKLISRGIATDISFPIINMNKDLYQFFGSNPSGHPLTAILNSIANSLFMRFCFHKLGYPVSHFKQSVKLMTLGDDNIMGSKEDGFNHTTISKVLADYGVPYTMADKKSASVPFINIAQCDFLKRRFMILNGEYVGPLDLNSIMKSLCVWVESKHITSSEHTAQCYLAARREWSLHGKDVFDNCVKKMQKLLQMEAHKHIGMFFIKRHLYDYQQTLDWVQERFKSPDSDGVQLLKCEDMRELYKLAELATF